MALKEENVFVTSGKKKASVRTETNAVSGMRATIVTQCRGGRNVCREKEVSEAKVTMVPFF